MGEDNTFTLYEVVFLPGSGFKVNNFGLAKASSHSSYTNLHDSFASVDTNEGQVKRPGSRMGFYLYSCFAFGEEDIPRAKESILDVLRKEAENAKRTLDKHSATYEAARRDLGIAASQVETAKLDKA